MKKENTGYLSATFLDIDITIVDNKFSLKLYDKRDDFGFSIVRMPYVSNNMPSTILDRMFAQGAEISRTRASLIRLYRKHQLTFEIFFDSLNSFLTQLLRF